MNKVVERWIPAGSWVADHVDCILSSHFNSGLNLLLVHVKWEFWWWNRSWRGDNISKINTIIGKFGSQKAVHWVVERGDFKVSEEHSDRFVVLGLHILEVSWGCHYNINYDIFIFESQISASVNCRENVNVPNSRTVEVGRAKNISWWKESSNGHRGVHSVCQVSIAGYVSIRKVSIGAINYIDDSNIELSLNLNVLKLGI